MRLLPEPQSVEPVLSSFFVKFIQLALFIFSTEFAASFVRHCNPFQHLIKYESSAVEGNMCV